MRQPMAGQSLAAHHIVERLGGYQAPCQIIDTLPVPICHTARRFQRRIFRTESVMGYCAAKDERYFGFKGINYGLIVHAAAARLWP